MKLVRRTFIVLTPTSHTSIHSDTERLSLRPPHMIQLSVVVHK